MSRQGSEFSQYLLDLEKKYANYNKRVGAQAPNASDINLRKEKSAPADEEAPRTGRRLRERPALRRAAPAEDPVVYEEEDFIEGELEEVGDPEEVLPVPVAKKAPAGKRRAARKALPAPEAEDDDSEESNDPFRDVFGVLKHIRKKNPKAEQSEEDESAIYEKPVKPKKKKPAPAVIAVEEEEEGDLFVDEASEEVAEAPAALPADIEDVAEEIEDEDESEIFAEDEDDEADAEYESEDDFIDEEDEDEETEKPSFFGRIMSMFVVRNDDYGADDDDEFYDEEDVDEEYVDEEDPDEEDLPEEDEPAEEETEIEEDDALYEDEEIVEAEEEPEAPVKEKKALFNFKKKSAAPVEEDIDDLFAVADDFGEDESDEPDDLDFEDNAPIDDDEEDVEEPVKKRLFSFGKGRKRNEEEEYIDDETDEEPEKPKKKFRFPFFGRKKNKDVEEELEEEEDLFEADEIPAEEPEKAEPSLYDMRIEVANNPNSDDLDKLFKQWGMTKRADRRRVQQNDPVQQMSHGLDQPLVSRKERRRSKADRH